MPDYQRLIDYDGNCQSWDKLLRDAEIFRAPKKKCKNCHGRGYNFSDGYPVLCWCVRRWPPGHKKPTPEEKEAMDELALQLRREWYKRHIEKMLEENEIATN